MIVGDKAIDDEMLPVILDEILVTNTKLRILSLNNNLIGDDGCQSIASFLAKVSTLEILYLSKLLLTTKYFTVIFISDGLENNNIQNKGA